MRNKHFYLVVLALSLGLFVLAACGQGTPDATSAVAVDTPAPAGIAPVATDGHDPRAFQPVPEGYWRTPFPEPVHMSSVNLQLPHWLFEGDDDMHNSPWIRMFRDELNIHVTWEWLTVGQEDYETRLNMAIAADDLPDVFWIPASMTRTFRDLSEAGMLLDLTHAYQNYTSQRIRDRELVDPAQIQILTVDSRIYGIPRYYYGQIDNPWHLWVRKDWHEALGSPEIHSVADLENLARAFMDEFGAAYGISVSNTLQWLFRTAPMFGAYVGNVHDNQYFWLPDETGRLRPGIAFPEFMVALEYWQRWFEEGLLSADFMTMDDTRAHENVVNGLVGIQPWWQWWGWMNGPTIIGIQGSNDAHFIPFNLPTVEGDRPARGQVFFPGGDIIVAHRDFQNPAALMKVISMVDSLMFDPSAVLTEDDIRYLMTDGREQSMGPVFNILDPQADMIMMQYVQRAIELNDPSILAGPRHLSAFADSYNWLNYRYPISALGRFLQLGFPGSAYSRAQHLFDNDWIVRDGRWGAVPEEFALAGPTGDIILQEAMQIIMGIQPVSHWHTVMEQWYAQGGQIKEDAVNLHFGN